MTKWKHISCGHINLYAHSMWEKQTAPPTNWPHQRHWTSNPSRKHTSICRRWCWCGEQNRTEQTKQTKLGAEKKKLYYGWFRESVWTHENKYLYERARALIVECWMPTTYVRGPATAKSTNEGVVCDFTHVWERAREREALRKPSETIRRRMFALLSYFPDVKI